MKTLQIIPLLLLTVLLFSCNDDENFVAKTDVEVVLHFEDESTAIELDDITVTFVNINSGSEIKSTSDTDGKVSLVLEEGVYSMVANGEKTITADGNEQTVTISGSLENEVVNASSSTFELPLFYGAPGEGWVIKEVYYAGSRTPENKAYYKDQYIEIYNNSSEVLYADGLTISEAEHNTSRELNEWADWLSQGVVVRTIYSIPGSGTEHPVQPGESLILASQPIDHTIENANSIDLKGAHWQWFDEGTTDVDVQEVPNLTKYYSYSKSFWLLHTSGYNSFILWRTDDMEAFMNTQRKETENTAGNTIEGYLVPNEIILDAVESSRKDKFLTKALAPQIDLTYTYCDETFSKKSIRRKVQGYDDGRAILMDTNNSDNDFIKNAELKPGEVE
ncbi:DUF4876 domain-containing protein [Carboxylicivirga mesophila]|uniref:DUF4876 domain-containing protein n=1 Tax=Carboxylicivirga mesophila TaxID=1166478 RepID=A0ABS5K7B9_9BACT|nr:DUF4876 domain-containing protein [Carboxylicivirga mesophila]MBS2210406.1 DUF4876 domain-containing protein [Carboxylicivirga mesophila]